MYCKFKSKKQNAANFFYSMLKIWCNIGVQNIYKNYNRGILRSTLYIVYILKNKHLKNALAQFNSVQWLSRVQLFVTPWTAARQASPSITQLLEFTQTHVHWNGDTIQPSHLLSSPSPPTFNLSQYQGLFKWISSSHQVAKILEFQLQHQSFQWIFRIDFL